MQCPSCQHENPPNAKFCLDCGDAFSIKCSNCGIDLPAGAKFCLECGTKVVTPSSQTTEKLPSTYTPQHLAERILTSRTAIEGERKQVTVLFADLTGSMELLADRDPEEARAILDPVLGHMMDAVHQYDGTVNQVMGDGIMALFGAPLALEDHAVRACYAAKRMQERISHYGDEVQRQYGVPIQLRIGLHSGDVVVRSIGSDLKMDYSAIGQTTHLAARMEQTAKPGTILATADTVKLAEGFIQVKPLGPVAVKGMSEPVEVFELTGTLMRRSRLQARAASGGLTQFVGRQREFEVLAEAAKNTRDGKGQVVATVGEPGVGKSRLFWEFTHSHHTHGCLVVEASSVSYGKATSFLPVIDLLKSYFQIGERDDARSVREKLTGKLLTLDRNLEPFLPPLLALLDQPVEDEQWQQLEPAQRRRQTLEALKQLWLRESQNQPLVLVFEDLHWIDSETQTFLNELLDKVPASHILLLFNYRPEYQSPWGSKTFFSQLRLDTLPVESTEELLTSLLGTDPQLAPLKQMLVKRGNPFFLEETVRTLVETGTLVGERGAYKLTKPIETLQIPATVQTMLAARIDRLDTEDKRLLQTASVIGKDVPFELLKAITDMDESELVQTLTRLQAAEFVYEAGLFPDVEYTFKHALTHEVAYGGLTHDRKQRLHAQIVNAIEQTYASRIDEYIERLAHHAQRGEVWDKASEFARLAGDKAFGRSANREAATKFEQAVTALGCLPQTPETIQQAIDLRLRITAPLVQLGELDRNLANMRSAEALVTGVDDPLRLGRVFAFLSEALRFVCQTAEAIRYGNRAVALARRVNRTQLTVVSNLMLGITYTTTGDLLKASDLLCESAEAASRYTGLDESEKLGRPAPPSRIYARYAYAWAHAYAAFGMAELGRTDDAEAHGQKALRMAKELNISYALAGALLLCAMVYSRRGDAEVAAPMAEQALHEMQNQELPLTQNLASVALGCVYNLEGRAAEAISVLEQGRGQVTRDALWFPMNQAYLAQAYGLVGRFEEARSNAHDAIEAALRYEARGDEAWARQILGEIHASCSPTAAREAQQQFQQALGLADQLRMRPLVAHCHAGLGRLNHRMGKKAEAKEELTCACEMYRDMDMTYYLGKAEGDLATMN